MAGRKTKPQVNQRAHHAAQVRAAGTAKQRLLAYCQWLAALAWSHGPHQVEAATGLVRSRIEELDPESVPVLKELQR